MTVSFKNGLDYADLMKIAHAINPLLLDPQLRGELDAGVNSLLSITSTLQGIPWILGLLPGNIGGQLDGAVKVLQLVKGLLEA